MHHIAGNIIGNLDDGGKDVPAGGGDKEELL
jgi:hypothetical protein